MALLMVHEGIQPAGQFDLADGYTASLKGGEIYMLSDFGVDSDGYQIVKARPATLSDGYGPFYLSDDGLTGYGVLFGNTVVRTDTGFSSGADNGTRLGPATYKASGKVTLWDKNGMYAVSLDALDANVTEAQWKTAAPNTPLTVTADGTGTLTLGAEQFPAVAYVVRYGIDESLVTTGGAVVNHKKLVIRFNPYGQI